MARSRKGRFIFAIYTGCFHVSFGNLPRAHGGSQNRKRSAWLLGSDRVEHLPYDKPSEDYRRTARFNIEGHPGLVFINDAGTHIITLDQRFGSGYGQIAAIYNPKGERLAQWTLGDLFKIDNHFHPKALPQFRRSTSSIYWRGEARWDSNQKSIHIGAPRQIEYREDGSYSTSHSSEMETYTMDLEKLEMKIIPSKTKKGNNSAPSKK